MGERWIWEIILYGKVFCSGECGSEEDARSAAKEYADKNLSNNTRMDAHCEVRKIPEPNHG